MRETLTVLAGLLVLTLLAALVGPGFVDWSRHRAEFETRLSATLGVEARIGGAIDLRLLPSPRLTLGDVRIGGQAEGESMLSVEQAVAEIALFSLARGEIRLSEAVLDGATLSLSADEAGGLRLPARRVADLPAQASLERLAIRRSAIIWREPGRAPLTLAPVALEASAVALAGPWRVEGEIDGASLRFSTGAIEPDGRLRTKANITGQATQIGFDGSLLLPVAAGRLGLGLEGGFTLSPGGAVALAGRVSGSARRLDLAGLSLDIAGGVARLDGEGHLVPAESSGALALRARRLDGDGLLAALTERPGFEGALAALPASVALSLDLDQIAWRGEDFAGVSLRGRLEAGALRDASAALKVAGASVSAGGSVDPAGFVGEVSVAAEDSRRVALALLRAGLDPAVADLVGGLGSIAARARGVLAPDRVAIESLRIAGSAGVALEGAGEATQRRIVARLSVQGLDLDTLPAASLASLAGDRDLSLDLSLTQARFRTVPRGQASLALSREGAAWRLSRLSIDGFGGVAVTGSGALLAEGGEIAGRVRAPRIEALTQLAGTLLPEPLREALMRAGTGLARLDAGFRLTRGASGETGITVDGAAAAGRLALDGLLDGAGLWRRAALRFDLAERRQAFAALGLPVPRHGGPGLLTLDIGPRGLNGALAGPGLSVIVEGDGATQPRLTVLADGPGQILPEGAARLLPDAVLDGSARLAFGADTLALDDLVATLGGVSARGALVLPREGAATGRLVLPRADLRHLVQAALGAGPAPAGGVWSSARFGPAAGFGLRGFALAVEAGQLVFAEGRALSEARLTLRADADGLILEDIAGGHGGGRVSGRLGLRRDGGLAQLSGRLGLDGLDAAQVSSGSLAGRLSGALEFGGSGESPARLISGLGGAGSLRLTGASLTRFDPAAYQRLIAATGEDASESDTARLERRLTEALDREAWALGEVAIPFTLAGGLARLQPLVLARNDVRAEASGFLDLRALSADLRLSLRPLGPLPKGWPTDAPAIGVAWRGPLSGLRREADVGALSNAVAARALAREIERVEAFEADARERAMHARRLRAERETRENERRLAEFLKAEEERRLAEEKRAEEARRIEEARRLVEEKRAEEQRRVEEIRRAAEERRLDELRRVEALRAEIEARRRAEAEERARAVSQPLVLPGARPFNEAGDAALPHTAPSLPPALDIAPAPRPLSRSPLPN